MSHLPYSERLKSLRLPSLEYKMEKADVVEVYKIMNQINIINKDKFFTTSRYTTKRGHSMKLFKKKKSSTDSSYNQTALAFAL